MEALGRSVDRLEDTISDNFNNKGDKMNDIAGLLALMQGNKGMDLPGLLALCKEKGYDRGWGGDGMFMFVFLILFLFAGGGWGNLNRGQQAEFAQMAGNNCQEIIGLHDRISAAQTAAAQSAAQTMNQFQQLQTWLCQSIDSVNAATRDQGDRIYDATRNVGDTIRSCCCDLNARLATVECELKGIERDISDTNRNLSNQISLSQERTNNALERMECRLSTQIKETQCLITTTATQQEMDRLRRENESLRNTIQGNAIADAAVSRLERFATDHYKVTNIPATATA